MAAHRKSDRRRNDLCEARRFVSTYSANHAEHNRGDGKRFVVRSDEKLAAFVELESAICAYGELN